MSWNDGYRTDLTYTHGYYQELSPVNMRFLLQMAGIVPPVPKTACELGYGQGISLNIHAAAEDTIWWGTDFNPSQAAFGGEMGKISGAHCLADSFQALCDRPDLPEFDYIALHGIWSWISAENQQAIMRLIDKKLRVGGVVYISYNTDPGWAAFRPLRELMKLHVDAIGGPGTDILHRIEQGVAFAQRLIDLKPGYAAGNPAAAERLKFFKGKDARYLAHELFNDAWSPSTFPQMSARLEESRLSFACSATPVALIAGLGLNDEQKQFMSGLQNQAMREFVLDFMYNTQFRKDYWIKGLLRMGQAARLSALRQERFVLTAPADKVGLNIKTTLGQLSLSEAAHFVILEILKDGKPHSAIEFEKLIQRLSGRENAPQGLEKENLQTILQSMLVLMSGGMAAVAQNPAQISGRKPITDKLNAHICQRAIDSGEIGYLASPVTGGGIQVGRFEQLFMLAIKKGANSTDAMAAFARDCLNMARQQILSNGKPLETQEETIQYLQKQAVEFKNNRLPLFKNLQLIF